MKKAIILLACILCGCASLSDTKSSPSYGTKSTGQSWTATEHNELYNAVTDNDTRITAIEADYLDSAHTAAADPHTVYQLELAEGAFADGDKTKLDSIASGADDVGASYDSSAELDALFSAKLSLTDIDDVAVNGVTNAPISSNWAYDHETNDSLHNTRLTEGESQVSWVAADATPDVTNGGSAVRRYHVTGAADTYTDFDDGDDHSEFAAGGGDWFVLEFAHASTVDCSSNANIYCNQGSDYTATAGDVMLFVWSGSQWQGLGGGGGGSGDITDVGDCSSGNCTMDAAMDSVDISPTSGTWDLGSLTGLEVPNSATLPATCTVGQVYIDTDGDTDGTMYICRAADTWKDIDDDGGAGGMATTDIDTSAELAAIVTDESGTGALIFAGGAIGAATATTPAADDNDTSVATTAYVQGELIGGSWASPGAAIGTGTPVAITGTTITGSSFVSSAADGQHYMGAINTVDVAATATAGRISYGPVSGDATSRHRIADGTDWNNYLVDKESIDTAAELETFIGGGAFMSDLLGYANAGAVRTGLGLDSAANLETNLSLGAYFSDIAAATSEANFKNITNLERPDLAVMDTTSSFSTPTTTNPFSLPAANCYGGVLFYGATGEIDLPAGVDGMNVIIYNTGAFTVTIDPNASEVIVRDGTSQTGGVSMTLSSGAGNFVTLVFDGTQWVTLGFKGTLAAGT